MQVGGIMKKFLSILSCLVLLVIITGCGNNKNSDDALKFKKEYEELNSSSVNMDISENNPIKYATFDEIIDVLTKGTGVVYFGFPGCPWCRNAIPVLFEVAKENDVDTIYYFNPREIRNSGNDAYQQLTTILNDYLEENDEGVKTLYVPDVYFVKDGKIMGNHLSTVDSQSDPYNPLDEEQRTELKNIYQNLFDKIK